MVQPDDTLCPVAYLRVVGGHDNGAALPVEPIQDIQDDVLVSLVQVACRLVGENQLAERIAVVQETVERLLVEGLDRHDAIHAIGSVVAEHLWKAVNEKWRGPDPQEEYFRRLEALTAREWLEGSGPSETP